MDQEQDARPNPKVSMPYGHIDTVHKRWSHFVHMKSEVTIEALQALLGKWVEVVAFGVSYTGRLAQVSIKNDTIKIVDKKDFVILEIERIEGFRHVKSV